MFSYLLSGKLGEFMAPRQSSSAEIWSLLKSGLFDKVLAELKRPSHGIEINLLDPSSGMAILHFACAGGAMELVVELLSQGADISLPSTDGNNALHYSALNERKGIVEILLRSGADPSVPNNAGLLPIELCTSREVSELFLRDRANIFSPIATIAQSRVQLADFIQRNGSETNTSDAPLNSHDNVDRISSNIRSDHYESPGVNTNGTSVAPDTNFSTTTALSDFTNDSRNSSGKMPVFNMTSEFDNEENEVATEAVTEVESSIPPPPVRSSSSNPALNVYKPQLLALHRQHSLLNEQSSGMVAMSPLNVRTHKQLPPLPAKDDRHDNTVTSESLSDSASMSDEGGDYTIVGVSSVRKPVNGNSIFNLSSHSLTRDESYRSEPGGEYDNRSTNSEHSGNSSPNNKLSKLGGASVPKLNLTHLSTLPPPPIDLSTTVGSYSARALSSLPPPPTVVSGALSARRGSGDRDSLAPSNNSAVVNSPTKHLPPGSHFFPGSSGVAVPHVMATPWSAESPAQQQESSGTSFSEYNSNNNRNQLSVLRKQAHQLHSHAKDSAQKAHYYNQQDSNSSFYSGYSPYEAELLQDSEELQRAVMLAATETAMSLQSSRDEYEARRLVIRNCQKLNEKHLRKLLAFDPTLAMSRATDLGALAIDGQTPLHIAAGFGNIDSLKILFEMGGSDVTAWVRDMQGRTPLHIAAEKGKTECCEFLRTRMRDERSGKDPVGVHAPVDLAGTTPLGWAAFGSKGKPKTGVETSLFKAGDRSILPLTPHTMRAGKSPWKASLSAHHSHHHNSSNNNLNFSNQIAPLDNMNIVFAFSEANGWTPMMEDRILICSPVALHASWNLFAVFDGHGGSYCSSYLASHIPAILSRHSADLSSLNPEFSGNDSDVTPDMLSALFTSVCVSADLELSEQPRMAVEKSESGKITCLDSSGSTAVMVLITPKYVVASNVGDSRAVLAQRTASLRSISSDSVSPTLNARKSFTVEDAVVVRAMTPNYNATTPANHQFGSSSNNDSSNNLDNLTASIERLNPNLSTPTTATPQPHNHNHYISSNVPNSPRLFSSGGSAGAGSILSTVSLTNDHKVYLPDERARAEAAGATVEQVPNSSAYQMSAKGSDVKLRMSRSFGDFYLKQNSALPAAAQAVIAVPEVIVHTRDHSRDAFIVLACDGIFDVMSNEEVVEFMGDSLGYNGFGGPVGGVTTQAAAEACDALLAEVLRRGTVDNISVILVVLNVPSGPPQTATGGSTNPYQYYQTNMSNVHNSGASAPSGPFAVQRRYSGTTPSTSEHMRGSHSADTLGNSHHHHPLRSPRDFSVDMPINMGLPPYNHGRSGNSSSSGNVNGTPQRPFQPTSLNSVFSNIAAQQQNQLNQQNNHNSHSSQSLLIRGFGLEDDAGIGGMCVSSPLNTMAGSSGRVRKQLQFNDS